MRRAETHAEAVDQSVGPPRHLPIAECGKSLARPGESVEELTTAPMPRKWSVPSADALSQPAAMLDYAFAYCVECDCFTYLMRRSRGSGKAHRRKGVLVGLRCCRCRKNRAVVGHFITGEPYGDIEQAH